MEITERALRRVYYITLQGRLDADSAPQLDAVLDTAFEQGRFRIVLDLEGLAYISSRGLTSLIRARKIARRSNRGDIYLVRPQQRVRDALELAGLLNFFPIYEDPVEAVGSF